MIGNVNMLLPQLYILQERRLFDPLYQRKSDGRKLTNLWNYIISNQVSLIKMAAD